MQVTGNNNQIHYNLSIRITADGFSFFGTEATLGDLMHREDFQCQDSEQLPRQISKMILRPTIQRHEYDNVRVVIDSNTTCIPLEEFRKEDLQKFFTIVFPNLDTQRELVCYTILRNLNTVQIYTVPRSIRIAISETYPDATYTNSHAVVLERVDDFSRRHEQPVKPLFAYAQRDQLFLFSIHQNTLLFANSFPIEDGEGKNALYYILSVWKSMGLNERENRCYISGDPEPAEKLAEEARKYLLYVEKIDSVDLAHL